MYVALHLYLVASPSPPLLLLSLAFTQPVLSFSSSSLYVFSPQLLQTWLTAYVLLVLVKTAYNAGALSVLVFGWTGMLCPNTAIMSSFKSRE